MYASVSARCHFTSRASHPTMYRTSGVPSWYQGLLAKMPGFCSPMPTTSGEAACAAAGTASSASAATAAQTARRTGSGSSEDGVLVRVGGRAAAEQHERLGPRVTQLVRRARCDHHAVARAHG